jgi:hypothetical protein
MAARPQRRFGRSDEERRQALRDLERQWDAEHRRHKQTVEQLRRARAILEEKLSASAERRRAEDQIRDAYHDSRARVIMAGKKR